MQHRPGIETMRLGANPPAEPREQQRGVALAEEDLANNLSPRSIAKLQGECDERMSVYCEDESPSFSASRRHGRVPESLMALGREDLLIREAEVNKKIVVKGNNRDRVELTTVELSHLHQQLEGITITCTLIIGFAMASLSADMLGYLGDSTGHFCVYKSLGSTILGALFIFLTTTCICACFTVIACVQIIIFQSQRAIFSRSMTHRVARSGRHINLTSRVVRMTQLLIYGDSGFDFIADELASSPRDSRAAESPRGSSCTATRPATNWDSTNFDAIVRDFMAAVCGPGAERGGCAPKVVQQLSTIPVWMFTDAGVDIKTFPTDPWNTTRDFSAYSRGGTLVDPSCGQLARYLARIVGWYTAGGFHDECGHWHASGLNYTWWGLSVLNEDEHHLRPDNGQARVTATYPPRTRHAAAMQPPCSRRAAAVQPPHAAAMQPPHAAATCSRRAAAMQRARDGHRHPRAAPGLTPRAGVHALLRRGRARGIKGQPDRRARRAGDLLQGPRLPHLLSQRLAPRRRRGAPRLFVPPGAGRRAEHV